MLTEKQIDARKQGIGASECGTVLGLNRWMSPYELWLIKTNRTVPCDISQKSEIIMGNLLEPVVATRYEQLTGEKLRCVKETKFHPKYPFILCHLDRKVVGKRKGIEIKTANPYSSEWGDAGSDIVPESYIAQVQHQLAVTGYEEQDLALFRGTTDFRIYPFKPDKDIIDYIEKKLYEFWNKNVIDDIAPELTTRRDVEIAHPLNNGNFIDCDENSLKLLQELRDIRQSLKSAEEEKKSLETEIIKIIGAADGIKSSDAILITFKANKNGVRSLRINERI